MKTFDQLTPTQQADAVLLAKKLLVSHLVEGVIEMDMPNKIVQKTFDKILTDTRQNETPSLAWDLLTSSIPINRELNRISWAAAEGAWYDDNGRSLNNENLN
jgi:hypothetical protein